MTVVLSAGKVVAGVPVTITVKTDPGTQWVWVKADDSYDAQPKVTYTGEIRVRVNGAQVAGGSGPRSCGGCCHLRGTLISSAPLNVRVHAAAPPAFAITAPAEEPARNLNRPMRTPRTR